MPAQPRSEDSLPFIDLTDDAPQTRPTAGRPKRTGGGEPLINIAQVAERLGVTVRHIRRLVYERRIPFIKWGHLLRFDPTDIARWIDEYRLGPGVVTLDRRTPRGEGPHVTSRAYPEDSPPWASPSTRPRSSH